MIAVIDYKAGNLTSVRLALEAIEEPCVITAEPEEALAADRVIFPGVGAAGSAMRTLQSSGMAEAIKTIVKRGTPTLGICLGTQIVFERSQEDNGINCLGLIPGTVRKFRPQRHSEKIPQMGWNSVRIERPHHIFKDIGDDSEFYFVHSYYPEPSDQTMALGRTEYAGANFASVITKDSLIATQFHPEKSGRTGLRMLKNFCNWNP
ncbi:MAG: imidazole glycerol phosphate synthase subunit HisH [Verrucomicrobiota bacterium]